MYTSFSLLAGESPRSIPILSAKAQIVANSAVKSPARSNWESQELISQYFIIPACKCSTSSTTMKKIASTCCQNSPQSPRTPTMSLSALSSRTIKTSPPPTTTSPPLSTYSRPPWKIPAPILRRRSARCRELPLSKKINSKICSLIKIRAGQKCSSALDGRYPSALRHPIVPSEKPRLFARKNRDFFDVLNQVLLLIHTNTPKSSPCMRERTSQRLSTFLLGRIRLLLFQSFTSLTCSRRYDQSGARGEGQCLKRRMGMIKNRDKIYDEKQKMEDGHQRSSRARSRFCLEDISSTPRVTFVTHSLMQHSRSFISGSCSARILWQNARFWPAIRLTPSPISLTTWVSFSVLPETPSTTSSSDFPSQSLESISPIYGASFGRTYIKGIVLMTPFLESQSIYD